MKKIFEDEKIFEIFEIFEYEKIRKKSNKIKSKKYMLSEVRSIRGGFQHVALPIQKPTEKDGEEEEEEKEPNEDFLNAIGWILRIFNWSRDDE